MFKKIANFQLKSTNVDQKYGFDFYRYNAKVEGIIVLLWIVILPLITLIFLNVFKKQLNINEEQIQLIISVSSIFFSTIGGLIFWKLHPISFFKSGVGILFIYPIAFLIMGIFSSICSQIIPGLFDKESKKITAWGSVFQTFIQLIAEIVLIIYAFLRIDDLKQRVKLTLKENKKQLIIVVVIFTVVMFLLGNVLYGIIVNKLGLGQSENQQNLIKPLKDKQTKIIYIILLLVFTVFVAPLFEEIIARNAIFTAVGSRWLSIVISTLFFGIMHIGSGDIWNITPYILGGLFLSLAFDFTRGNITYSWLIHSTYNLISLTITIATN